MIFAHIFTTLHRGMRRRACSWLFFPSRRSLRQIGPSQDKLKKSLIHYLFHDLSTSPQIELFYNARSAIYHGIQALGIGKGDEIILQAYTCISVPNAIIATGARPIYCDIDPHTINIDPQHIKTLITSQTKAILIQHTFGIPANIAEIQKICSDYNLVLIEDCCHALGVSIQGRKLGTFGDISVFSFGRDKIISSVNGGALIINTPHTINTTHLRNTKAIAKKTIVKNLLYIIIGQISKVTYSFGIGKLIYYVSAKIHLFPSIVDYDEKQCNSREFDYQMPNCLADIAYHEINNIDTHNTIRANNSKLYEKLLGNQGHKRGILRYLYRHNNPISCATQLKQQGIMLGDRYQQVIAPKDSNHSSAYYISGSCPQAELLASQSLNLPNHSQISKHDIKRISQEIKKCQ